ncbi:hypothetical protein BJ508DRAFT_83767 [Ascobolus immersus RN42]|uniref:Centrosomin N-terminal motif 1 domain-containing protein n=1 Tax=Ascobolus immersus RN42 TaxID=1160509 RepID=A0A3N4IMD3_ASCIM|nr:hypothetical protein BJ508DRAFT_83767 [Ascobolus immersus RN42]
MAFSGANEAYTSGSAGSITSSMASPELLQTLQEQKRILDYREKIRRRQSAPIHSRIEMVDSGRNTPLSYKSVERKAASQTHHLESHHQNRRRSPSVARTMGVKETEEVSSFLCCLHCWSPFSDGRVRDVSPYISKLKKENFDMKLELYHRREKWQDMVEKSARANELEKQNVELMDINDKLYEALENRDQALGDAVCMIARYEKHVADLEMTLEEVKTKHEEYKEKWKMPRITLSGDELAAATPYRLRTLREKLAQSSRFINFDEPLRSTKDSGSNNFNPTTPPKPRHLVPANITPIPYRPNDSKNDQRLSPFHHSFGLPSPCFSNQGEQNLSLLDSPRLSILSESSFLSVYGKKDESEPDVISEFDEDLPDFDPFLDDPRVPARNLFDIKPEDEVNCRYKDSKLGTPFSGGLRASPRLEIRKFQQMEMGMPSPISPMTSIGYEGQHPSPNNNRSSPKTPKRATGSLPESRIPVRSHRRSSSTQSAGVQPSVYSPVRGKAQRNSVTGIITPGTTPPGTFNSSPPKWTPTYQKARPGMHDASTSPMSVGSHRESPPAPSPPTPRPSTGRSMLFTMVGFQNTTPERSSTPRRSVTPPKSIISVATSSRSSPDTPVMPKIRVQASSPPKESVSRGSDTTVGRRNTDSKGRLALTRMGKAALNATRRTSSTLKSKVSDNSLEEVKRDAIEAEKTGDALGKDPKRSSMFGKAEKKTTEATLQAKEAKAKKRMTWRI